MLGSSARTVVAAGEAGLRETGAMAGSGTPDGDREGPGFGRTTAATTVASGFALDAHHRAAINPSIATSRMGRRFNFTVC